MADAGQRVCSTGKAGLRGNRENMIKELRKERKEKENTTVMTGS